MCRYPKLTAATIAPPRAPAAAPTRPAPALPAAAPSRARLVPYFFKQDVITIIKQSMLQLLKLQPDLVFIKLHFKFRTLIV
ncbi:hypothetical protein ABZP36_019419 [Zizania latifolia]